MAEARIHPYGKLKPTEAQLQVAERLVAEDRYVYLEKRMGKGLVGSFERYLKTGDASKITPALYTFLTVKCGFIAHYGLEQFRGVYRDPVDLLDRKFEAWGRMFGGGLADGPVKHSQSVYADGMTSSEVWEQMAEIAKRLGSGLRESRARKRHNAEVQMMRELAHKHGYKLERA